MKKEDLKHLRHNAIDLDKDPAFVLDYAGEVWVAIPFHLFEREYL